MSREPWEGHEVEVVNPRYAGAAPSNVARSLLRPTDKLRDNVSDGDELLDEPED